MDHFEALEEAKKYCRNSMVLDGKGVDRYIIYIEYKDGTPLTDEELDNLLHKDRVHDLLIE
jgi:hypothetical protein